MTPSGAFSQFDTGIEKLSSPVHQNIARNVHQVITAVPHLTNHPALALAAAQSKGNPVDAAQGIGGLQMLHASMNGILNWAHDGVIQNQMGVTTPPQQASLLSANTTGQKIPQPSPSTQIPQPSPSTQKALYPSAIEQALSPSNLTDQKLVQQAKQGLSVIARNVSDKGIINIAKSGFDFVHAFVDGSASHAVAHQIGHMVKNEANKAWGQTSDFFNLRPVQNPDSGGGPLGVHTLVDKGLGTWVASGIKHATTGANNIQEMYKMSEYLGRTQGRDAQANYWAQIAMMALGTAAVTHNPGSGLGVTGVDVAINAEKTMAPDVMATGVKEAAANATPEAESAAIKNHQIVMDALNQAKNNVFEKANILNRRGLFSSKLSAQNLSSMLNQEFNSIVAETPDIQISNLMQQTITKHFDEIGIDLTNLRTAFAPFRWGATLGGDFARPLTSTVGKMVEMINKAGDAPTVFGTTAISPTIFKNEYHNQWNEAQKNEMTIGQSLSTTLGLGRNSAISGTTDFFVSIVEPQFTGARALGFGDKSLATVQQLDNAFARSPRYLNALRIMKGSSAGEIQRKFDYIPPYIAEAIGKLTKDATIKDVHEIIRGGVIAEDFANPFRIPRMGLYGMLRGAKTSDGKIAEFFAHTFAQQAIVVTEKGIETNSKFAITDPNAIRAISQNLQSLGFSSKEVTVVADKLNAMLAEGDIASYNKQAAQIFKETLRENLQQALDNAYTTTFSKNPNLAKWMKDLENLKTKVAENKLSDEERKQARQTIAQLEKNLKPFEGSFKKFREAINEFVDKAVGDSGSGTGSKFVSDLRGMDPNKTIDANGKNILGSAVLFNERGDLHFVNYRDFNSQIRELIKSWSPEIKEAQIKNLTKLRKERDGLQTILNEKPLSAKDYKRLESIKQQIATSEKLNLNNRNAVAQARIAERFFRISDGANKWVNDYFFKPLALLTPGWALRVSTAEAALNIARLGPINFASGVFGANLQRQASRAIQMADNKLAARGLGKASSADIEKELFALLDQEAETTIKKDTTLTTAEQTALVPPPRAKEMMTTDGVVKILKDRGYGGVTKDVARNIALFIRGMVAGADRNVLRLLGHEEYIRNATFLAFQHDGYLPDVADARHHYPAADYDVPNKTAIVTTDRKIIGGGAGRVKVKNVLFGDTYQFISFSDHGYYEAWKYGAHKYASDEFFGNPLANAYRNIIEKNPKWAKNKISIAEGRKLHTAVVMEARRILETIPQKELETMDRYIRMAVPTEGEKIAQYPLSFDTINSWAETAVRGLESKIRGQGIDGTGLTGILHKELLDAIADRTVPTTTEQFIREYGMKKTAGGKLTTFKEQEVAPNHVGRTVQNIGTRSLISRASTFGHQKVLGPIVNHLVRQPTYIVEFSNARKQLQDLVDRKIYTPDQADVEAQIAAAQNMVRFIHNPMDKLHWEENMRVIAPFYFAQNQAWRRAGRLFAENPGAFMQYMATMLAVTKWVSETSSTVPGMKLVTMPMAALFHHIPYMGGLGETAMTFSTSTINTIDPVAEFDVAGLGSSSAPMFSGGPNAVIHSIFKSIWGTYKPAFGPIVSVPAHVILEPSVLGNLAPTINAAGKTMYLGNNLNQTLQDITMGPIGQATPLWQAFIPNSILRQAFEGALFTAGLKKYGVNTSLIQGQIRALTSNVNIMMEKEQKKLYKQYPPDLFPGYAETQLNIYGADLLNDQTDARSKLVSSSFIGGIGLMVTKLLLSLVSPVSVGIGATDPAGRAVLRNYQKMFDTANNPYLGNEEFYVSNPSKVADMIGLSTSTTGGTIPETVNMEKILSDPKNMALANKYRLGAWAFIGGFTGPNTNYSQKAANALIASDLRQKSMPEDFIKSLSLALGNEWYYTDLKRQYAIVAASGQLTKSQMWDWEQNQINDYGKHNPTWHFDFVTHKSSIIAKDAYAQVQKMISPVSTGGDPIFQNPKPNTPEARFKASVEDFSTNYYPALDALLTQAAIPYNKGMNYNDIKFWWDNTAMPQFLANHPDQQNAVISVYSRLG
jgi:hypothetical protein